MAEAQNILTRNPLESAQDTMWFYVVYNNRDYRVNFATLLNSISKATVGLSNVDNTADISKPVSLLQQQALDQKLSIEEFNNFTAEFETYLTRTQIEQMIAELNARVDSVIDQTELNAIIQPLQSALDQYNQRLTSVETSLGDFVTNTSLAITLSNLQQTIMTDVSNVINGFSSTLNALDSRMLNLENTTEERFMTIEQRLTSLEGGSACNIVIGELLW